MEYLHDSYIKAIFLTAHLPVVYSKINWLIMNGVFAQIISMFSFGVSNALWRKPINKLIAEEAIIYRTVFSISFFIVLLFFVKTPEINVKTGAFGFNIWVFTFIVSCLSYFGLFFFNKALKFATTGLVVIVTTTSYLFLQFTSILILGESPKVAYILPFGLFLISILIADYKSIFNLKFSKGVIFGLLAAFFWGTTLPLLSIPSKQIGFVQTGLILESSVMLMSVLCLFIVQKRKLSFNNFKKDLQYFVLLGFFAGNGVLFNNLSYTKIPVYLAGSIASCTHLVTILVSWILFKERLKPHQYVAAILAGFAVYYVASVL